MKYRIPRGAEWLVLVIGALPIAFFGGPLFACVVVPIIWCAYVFTE
jgi:hypothetical protein